MKSTINNLDITNLLTFFLFIIFSIFYSLILSTSTGFTSFIFCSPTYFLYYTTQLTSVVVTTSQKTNSNTSNKSQDRYQVDITRKLNKKSLIYCYPIYTKLLWSMLTINSPTLMFMYSLCFHHISTLCLL